MKLFKINDDWFYSDPKNFLRLLTIFIKGDAIILVPFFILLAVCFLVNLNFGIITLLLFISLRFFGEMIYWFLQQFSNKEYRPYDFGFKNLSNNSIYILYQLFDLCVAALSVSLLFYIFIF